MPKYLVMPKIGMNMTEGTIAKWLIAPGDRIEKEQIILEAETDKAIEEIVATEGGIVYQLLANEGDVVPCQAKIALLLDDDEEPPGKTFPNKTIDEVPIDIDKNQRQPEKDVQLLTEIEHKQKISPLARKTAADLGVNLQEIFPREPGLRITKNDVLRMYEKSTKHITSFVEQSKIRKITAEKMRKSVLEKPKVTLICSVNCEELLAWRNHLKEKFGASYNELIMKLCAHALQLNPMMNSVSEGEKVRLLDEINICLAIDTEDGLVAPVIRFVDEKSIQLLSEELKELREKAYNSKLSIDDITGGSFTITNLGMYDVESFDPIINGQQCAILGVGTIKEVPAVINHNIAIQKSMKLSLSFDHAMVDGATAAKFLQDLKVLIEHPSYLLM